MKVDDARELRSGSTTRWPRLGGVGAGDYGRLGAVLGVMLVSAGVSFVVVSRSTPDASQVRAVAPAAQADDGASTTSMPAVAFDRLGVLARRAGRLFTRGGSGRPGANGTPEDPLIKININRPARLSRPAPVVAFATPVETASVEGPAAKLDQALRRLVA